MVFAAFFCAKKCFKLTVVMKLADSSHQRLENFFREYLRDGNFKLPVIKLHVGKFAKILTRVISVHGITLGRHIFITPQLVSLNQKNFLKLPENLVAHEIAHTLQYEREGFLRFLYKYVSSYRRNLRQKKKWDSGSRHEAYLEIPFEIEARHAAAEFVEWRKRQQF